MKGRVGLIALAILSGLALHACSSSSGGGGSPANGGGAPGTGGTIGNNGNGNGGNGGGGSGTSFTGVLQGGAAPISGSTVTLYQAGTTSGGAAKSLASTTSDSTGGFSMSPVIPTDNSILYLVASGGNAGAGANSAIKLALMLGPANNLANLIQNNIANSANGGGPTANFTVNEVSTVALVYAMNVFIQASSNHSVSGPSSGLQSGAGTGMSLISSSTGAVSTSLDSNTQNRINGLANVVASCVAGSAASCQSFFNAAAASGPAPTNTFDAVLAMAQSPNRPASALWALIGASPPYPASPAPPNLFVAPNTGVGAAFSLTSSLSAIAVDSSGNVWATNTGGNSVTEIPHTATSCASGCTRFSGGGINQPSAIAADGSGNVWVANAGSNSVTKISSGASPDCSSGCTQFTGGNLSAPSGIAVDSVTGDVWVSNFGGSTNLAGGSTLTEIPAGSTDCTKCINFTKGALSEPMGITVDKSENVWVANLSGVNVTEILKGAFTAASCSGSSCALVNPVPASPTVYKSFTNPSPAGSTAFFSIPVAIVADASGNAWVTNTTHPFSGTNTDSVTEITAGAATDCSSGCNNFTGGGISQPSGITVSGAGIWVANTANNSVTEISSGAASNCTSGCTEIVGGGLSSPSGIAADASGNVWVANVGSVTKIPAGATSSCAGCVPFSGAGIGGPVALAVDASSSVWIASLGGNIVTSISNAAASFCFGCFNNNFNNNFCFPFCSPTCTSSCVPSTGGSFSAPDAVAVDGSGNVWVANSGNNSVIEIQNANTFCPFASCGSGPCSSPCITYTSPNIVQPTAIAVDGSGNVWVANGGGSNSVTQIPASVQSTGQSCNPASSCPTFTGFNSPAGITADAAGNVWVANFGGGVTKIPAKATDCSGCVGYAFAGFSSPSAIAGDPSGNIWVANFGGGVTEIPAGAADCTKCVSFSGSGLSSPDGIAADAAGNVWVANFGGSSVTEIPAGATSCSSACSNIVAGVPNLPTGIAVDASGDLWVGNSGSNTVSEIIGVAAPTGTPVIGPPAKPS